jgi:hypothetical protein
MLASVESSARCEEHPETPAFGRCSRCDRALCDACLPNLIEGEIACAACATVALANAGRPWAFAGAILVTFGTGAFALARAEAKSTGTSSWFLYGLAGAIVLGVVGFVLSKPRQRFRVEPRASGVEAPPDGPPHGAYRQAAHRRFVPRVPPLSGRLVALALLLSCAFTALAAPFTMHLPTWVEAEIVLGAWWVTWTATLAVLLYRGRPVADDHRFSPAFWFGGGDEKNPASGPKAGTGAVAPEKKSSGRWHDGLSGVGDGEGCAYVLGAILIAGAAVLLAWVLVELVVPAVFTLAYMLLIRALKRATNDTHGCKGEALRSLGYGALWSALYVVPIAVVVVLVHAVARK